MENKIINNDKSLENGRLVFHEKQMLILKELITNEKPVNGTILSRVSNLSLKTVRKEINIVNSYLKSISVRIVSIPGEGYKIAVEKEQAYDEFRVKFLDVYNRRLYFKDDQQSRVHYIIRRLLVKPDRVYLENIADECYVSKSLINRDMHFVKKELSRYNIQVINQTNKGITITGDEWSMRTCLIQEHRIYINFSKENIHEMDASFGKFFFLEQNLYSKIRDIVFKTFIQYRIFVSRSCLKKIIFMIIFAINRKNQSSQLSFTEEELKFYENTKFYSTAKTICKRLAELGIFFLEQEITSLAVYMACLSTVRIEELNHFGCYEQAVQSAKDILDHINSIVPIWHVADEELIEDLACNLFSLQVRQQHKVFLDDEVVLRFEEDGLFSLDLCMYVVQYFRKNGNNAYTSEVLQLYYVFASFLSRNYKANEKKYSNILLFSRNGYYVAKNLSVKLSNIFNDSNLKFEPIEYIELFMLNLKEYDLLLTDFTDHRIEHLEIEKMNIQFFRKTKEINDVISKIMQNRSLDFKELFRKEDVFRDVCINSVEELYKFLKQEVLINYEMSDMFIRECEERETYFPSIKKNQVAVLKSLNDCLGESIIKIIVPMKPFEWASRTCRFVFLYNVKDNDFAGLYYMNRAIANIIHNLDSLPEATKKNLIYDFLYSLAVCTDMPLQR